MRTIRRGSRRFHTDLGWLDSRHSFSFGPHRDPRWMGFRGLRVLNDDLVQPASGFGTHPHRDMDILSYVVEGALEHKDSAGHGSVIRPGDLQRMSAGRGIAHSEWNASREEPVRFLQIWLPPRGRGGEPSYAQAHFPVEQRQDRLRLVASEDGREGSLVLDSSTSVHAALLSVGARVEHRFEPGRHGWLQVVRGRVHALGDTLEQGDGMGLSGESLLSIEGLSEAEILLFDLE